MKSEQYIKLIHSKNPDLQCMTEYTGAKCIMTVQCKICGNVFERRADSLKIHCTCQTCSKLAKLDKTKNKFLDYIQLHNIKLIEPYIDTKSKVKYKCLKCGYVWSTTPESIMQGHGCAKCASHISYKLTTEDFIEKAKQVQQDNYDYSNTKYTEANAKLTIGCPRHGLFEIFPNNFIRRGICPKCSIEQRALNRRLSIKDFVEKARQVHGNKYDYSKVKYFNRQTKISIICPTHGEFMQTPAHHLKGCGCQKCSQSHGENFVEQYLQSKNILFQQQYVIHVPENIRSSGKIYVDFYIRPLNTIIEYNGKQHYIPIKHFGGQLTFDSQKKRDNYLRQYCLDNKIRLIELPQGISFDILRDYLDTYLIDIRQPPAIIPMDFFYTLLECYSKSNNLI